MKKIYNSVEELVGNTPIISLKKLEEELGLKAQIFAKLEGFNPAGSIKDRVAKAMLEDAILQGKITEQTVIIEPTSGNTGIGLSSLASARGLKCIIVMPDTMSVERRKLVKAYGAELVLTDGKQGMAGAIKKAEELANTYPSSFIAGQFENPSNPLAHYKTTAPELYESLDGNVDIFVCGIGTGGTISGVGAYLKEKNPNVKIIGVEPSSSPYLSKGYSGAHGLQGIGAGFKPKNLREGIVDQIITVSEEQAYSACRLFAKKEGLLVGISSGACLHACLLLANASENHSKRIATIFPDGGEKYLSTPLFSE